MSLKLVEQFDSAFTLDPEAKANLVAMLTSDAFCDQITAQLQTDPLQVTQLEFTGMLFQPVPYTPNEPKGMPADYEQYHNSPDYLIINVPPNFMFKAKIFKPSRLCAIYTLIRE
ncbi:MAG: hypothetical protein VKL39_01560 [Leptolyngbyaceae bacterium]|nr:hypothetical protein [Leptolyngbyaceae bacterium]